LGHDPLIRCDHHGHQIDARGASDHVFDEFFVTRNIHDPQVLSAGKVQEGESELDGDAPLFFFFQAVGVDTGNGLDQGGLSVVDMPGGAEYDLFQFTTAPLYDLLKTQTSAAIRYLSAEPRVFIDNRLGRPFVTEIFQHIRHPDQKNTKPEYGDDIYLLKEKPGYKHRKCRPEQDPDHKYVKPRHADSPKNEVLLQFSWTGGIKDSRSFFIWKFCCHFVYL
jgi:hypothetical protein